MQKLALFLATEKGYTCLKSLIAGEKVSNVGCVFSFNENNVVHSWKDNLPSIFTKNKITSAIVISWRHLIPLKINNFLKVPLIVFHDFLLPFSASCKDCGPKNKISMLFFYKLRGGQK